MNEPSSFCSKVVKAGLGFGVGSVVSAPVWYSALLITVTLPPAFVPVAAHWKKPVVVRSAARRVKVLVFAPLPERAIPFLYHWYVKLGEPSQSPVGQCS